MIRSRLCLETLEERNLLTTLTVFQRQVNPLASFFALGGEPGRVQVRQLRDGSLITDFAPFGPSYQGSITLAVGDVNHDGIDDLIAGTADGIAQVKIFDGAAFQNGSFRVGSPDLSLLGQFSPYAARFHVGVNVAAGDIENNGFADIITAPTSGNPDVRVFRGKDIADHTFNPTPGASLLLQFFPYEINFNIGANVAAGDVTNDGYADLVTGATAGNPDVRVYNGRDIAFRIFQPVRGASLLAQFFAYDLNKNLGAFVSVGDTNSDGFGNVITGQTTGGSQVKVFDGRAIAGRVFNPDNNLLDQFFAFDPGQDTGVTVASSDFEVPGRFDILTGNAHQAPNYRVVRGNARGIRPPAVNRIDAFAVDIRGGIFVGA